MTIKVPKTNDVIAISFIKIFIDGPLVSLRGSPTVSPHTAAECSLSPFLTNSEDPSFIYSGKRRNKPASTYFLALSHAPPVLEAENAIWIPDTIVPGIIPLTNL